MKAAVVQSVGAKWEVKDVPTPEPSANQVLIKVHASGVCHTDASITEGSILYGPRDIRFEERKAPNIVKPTDAIIRNSATCVCV